MFDGRVKMKHVRQFGRLPVLQDGRVKPIDTVARTTLMIISGRGEEFTDLDGQKQPAKLAELLVALSDGLLVSGHIDDPKRVPALTREALNRLLGDPS